MANYEIKVFTISQIIDYIKNNEIILPTFQRGIVWKKEKCENFIKNLHNGDPVGCILLSSSDSDAPYKLIDGLQRISTIKKYVDNIQNNLKISISNTENFIEKLDYLAWGGKKGQILGNDNLKNKRLKKLKEDLFLYIEEFYKNQKNEIDKSILQKIIRRFIEKTYQNKLNDEEEDNLDIFYKEIIEKVDFKEQIIPAIIYNENNKNSNLPKVFENLNTGGINLSKYEIFAAQWYEYKIIIDKSNFDEEIYNVIVSKYNSLNEIDLEVDFNQEDLKEEIGIFEYCFSISNLLINRFPNLFGKIEKGKTYPIGFDIVSLVLTNTFPDKNNNIIKKLKLERNKKFKNYDFLVKLKNCIITVFKKISNEIHIVNCKNFSSCKAIYNFDNHYPLNNNYQLYHIFMFFFKNMYKIDLDSFIIEEKKFKNKYYEKYLFINYFFDYFTHYWSKNRQVANVENLIINEDILNKYSVNIDEHEFKEEILNSIKERDSQNSLLVPLEYKVFLAFFSNMLSENNLEYREITKKSNTKFDVDHIISKKELENLKNKIPISSIGNLMYLSYKTNRSKGAKTIYDIIPIEAEIKNLFVNEFKLPERNTLDDIICCRDKQKKENFEKFLQKRILKLVNKLFELTQKWPDKK